MLQTINQPANQLLQSSDALQRCLLGINAVTDGINWQTIERAGLRTALTAATHNIAHLALQIACFGAALKADSSTPGNSSRHPDDGLSAAAQGQDVFLYGKYDDQYPPSFAPLAYQLDPMQIDVDALNTVSFCEY